MAKKSSKALIGRQDIMDHLAVGKSRFYELVAAGLPVQKKGGKTKVWTAHADQIDEWFKVGM